MNTIAAITKSFTKEDHRDFINFLQKKNRRGDTKNILLFQYISRGETKNLDEKLYGKSAKNAYHALSKRLQDNLIEFVATKSFDGETSEEMNILKLLLASRIFFENKQHKIGFKTLLKAERMATALDVYSILTEIYHTKIQYAHLQQQWDLPNLILRAQRNLLHFQQEQQLNMAYAQIKQQLATKSIVPASEIIEKAFEGFNIELNSALTYKSLFQLMSLLYTSAQLEQNYHSISAFMDSFYKVVSEKEPLADKHAYYHIEILNLMAHTHFRLKNFEASSSFSEKMKAEMMKNNERYYNRFQEKLILIQALNFNYTNRPQKAIQMLTSYQYGSLDIGLTLIMTYFQQNEMKKAYAVLKAWQHSDRWYEKKMGWVWVLKKSIIEILLLIELDELDLVLSRLQSFKKKFIKQLKERNEQRVIAFMQLVNRYYENPNEVTTESFAKKVESAFEWKEAAAEDVFVMSFYAWLKSKMEGRPLYETTLELVRLR